MLISIIKELIQCERLGMEHFNDNFFNILVEQLMKI